jgi:hypothetical protein
MKQVSAIESNCTLCEPWIKVFFYRSFCNLDNLKKKQGFYLWLFGERKPEEKFLPKPNVDILVSVDIVVFSSFMTLLRMTHVIF